MENKLKTCSAINYRFVFKSGCGSKRSHAESVELKQLLEAIWDSNEFQQFCYDNDLEMRLLSNADLISEYAQFVGERDGGHCTIEEELS